ncbi:unnamed protein product [Schistosoma margrebowiei]|uniref:Uncharacterized protein n=1 Tax=Schistosoma margrebowiei TaxID=48269 RepID=A0A183LX90_9TREM|nr:unnamed protein product [Schistosoma margrebowiei]
MQPDPEATFCETRIQKLTTVKQEQRKSRQRPNTEAHKRVKRSIRADKQKYMRDIAMIAERAERGEHLKQLCDSTKKLVGKYSKPDRPVNNKEVKLINGIQDI